MGIKPLIISRDTIGNAGAVASAVADSESSEWDEAHVDPPKAPSSVWAYLVYVVKGDCNCIGDPERKVLDMDIIAIFVLHSLEVRTSYIWRRPQLLYIKGSIPFQVTK